MDGGKNVGGCYRSMGSRPSSKGYKVFVRSVQKLGLHCQQKVRPVTSKCRTETGLPIVAGSFYYSYGQNFYAQPGVSVQESSLGPTGLHLCFLQMMLSCFLLWTRTRTFRMYQNDLQLSVNWLG